MMSLNGVSVYGAFVVGNEKVGEVSSNTKPKIILVDQKYKSDRFTYNIISQVKNIGNCNAEFVQINFNLFNKKGELIGTDYTLHIQTL